MAGLHKCHDILHLATDTVWCDAVLRRLHHTQAMQVVQSVTVYLHCAVPARGLHRSGRRGWESSHSTQTAAPHGPRWGSPHQACLHNMGRKPAS